ncbi:uncharacterized protein LOC143286925 [Babylonia areolata]|uniref:uncharacterized protein LOC143286925 n=1 Tax=Babylonia areolata TaxID=304850 RepID=UPI003FD014AF
MRMSGCLVKVTLMTAVYVALVPSVVTGVPLSASQLYGYHSDTAGVPYSTGVEKRSKGVDAWSICPPSMTDVDCFYAYLRVYARLRKAAEESDRVSMRNIGKRSQLTSLPAEAELERSRLRRMPLCSDRMPPALCYLSAMQLYRRVLADMDGRL